MQAIKPRRVWWVLGGTLTALLGTGYWYIFVAGAPQFDPPAVETAQQMKQEGLSFQLETFNSQSMGVPRTYGVMLPPGYQQHPERRYPVIFLLHGGHDNGRAFIDKYGIATVLGNLYKENKLPPSIIISPDGNDNRGSSPLWDPQYFDGANGKVGSLIGSELVQLVKSRYRTLDDPRYWAIGGVSSGGWGALNIGLQHVNNFNIFFSHSGYFTDNSGPQNSPNSFVKSMSKDELQRIRIYLDAGQDDTDLLASTQQFHQTLNALKVNNVFYAFPGGHGLSGPDVGWNYFHKHLYDSLSYVGTQLQQAGTPN